MIHKLVIGTEITRPVLNWNLTLCLLLSIWSTGMQLGKEVMRKEWMPLTLMTLNLWALKITGLMLSLINEEPDASRGSMTYSRFPNAFFNVFFLPVLILRFYNKENIS